MSRRHQANTNRWSRDTGPPNNNRASEISQRSMDRDRGDKHQREKVRDVRIVRERSPRGVKRSRSPRPENSRSPRPSEKSRSPGSSDTRPTEKYRSPRSSENRSRSPRPPDRTSRVPDTRARASRDETRSHRRVDYHSPRPADSHRDRRPHHTHRESGHRSAGPKEKELVKPDDAPLAPSLPAKLEVDSSSDSEKEQNKPDSIKIEDLIKEIEEGPTSGDESGSGSDEDGGGEAEVRGNGEGTSSDADSREEEEEGVVSDVTEERGNGSKRSGTGSTEKAIEEEEEEGGEEKPTPPADAGEVESKMADQRSRSKFDDPSDEEEEGRREEWESMQVKHGYSGYNEGLSNGEESSGGEDVEEGGVQEQAPGEEAGKGEGEDVKEVVEEEEEPSSALPCYYPGLMGCRNVECFEWLNRIEEGTYGVVYRARERTTGKKR